MSLRYSLVVCLLLLGAPRPASSQPRPLDVAFPALTFTLAVDLQHAGDGTNRLFAAEQAGVIKVFANDPTVAEAAVFLDIQDRVLSNDRFGLLGMTFHPDYAANGFFYVHYTASAPQRSVIARYRVSAADPDEADRDTEVVLLEVAQPHRFHNGGQLAFGPDGYLYIGLGDGGPGRDPSGHGQNRRTLLGSMLRIDVDTPTGDRPYSIPADNPFAGNTEGFREEIWAWGFRNPWRFSFDPETGWLWTADNGEDAFEEVDVVERGGNYGWKTMEAGQCFSPSVGCNMAGLTLPVWEYGGSAVRRSVIGGYVYRGQQHPDLVGAYLYADFLTGQGWALTYDGINPATNRTLFTNQPGIGTFGVDEQGEVYMSNLLDGKLYRFAATATSVETPPDGVAAVSLQANYPNPFATATTIAYHLPQAAHVTLTVYDALGRTVRTLVDARQPAGDHRHVFRPVGLPPGVYLYRLHSGGQTRTRALLLTH